LREYQFDNLSMLNIYVYIELVLACLVFTKFWGLREMRVYLASAIAFSSLCAVLFALDVGSATFSWIENAISATIITIMCLHSLNKLTYKVADQSLRNHYFFWVTVAFLVYFLGNLFIFV